MHVDTPCMPAQKNRRNNPMDCSIPHRFHCLGRKVGVVEKHRIMFDVSQDIPNNLALIDQNLEYI